MYYMRVMQEKEQAATGALRSVFGRLLLGLLFLL